MKTYEAHLTRTQNPSRFSSSAEERPRLPPSPLLLCLEFARAEQGADPYGFRFVPQDYLARRAGGRFESLRFPWDPQVLEDLQSVRLLGRDPVAVQRLGETLRKFLGPLGWIEQEERLLEAVWEGRHVFLTIRSAAAELYSLPWELCTLKSTGQYIGELPGVLIRYEWPDTQSVPELKSRLAGERVLFAWSAAAGAVPAADHLEALRQACKSGLHPFDTQADVLANVSCGRLSRCLKAAKQDGRPIAVLHLLCHGTASGSIFGLAMDGDQPGEGAVVVNAARLRQILAPHADMLRMVVLVACDSGNCGSLANQMGSVAQTLHRAGIAAVVASRYPLSVSGSVRLTEALYGELLRGPSSLERALIVAREYLAEDAAQLDWASLQLYARSQDGEDSRPVPVRPFRGLLTFQSEHQRFLFGRQAEISEVLSDIDTLQSSGRPRFLIVAGASGTGKSSLILAGVVPALLSRPEAGWRSATIKPGSQPMAMLEQALSRRENARAPLLLVVDQFEEIFTNKISSQEQQDFTVRLWTLAQDPSSRLQIILTLRVDFIGLCSGLVLDSAGLRLDRVAYDDAHRVFVPQMKREQIAEVILRPAQLVGLQFEAGLMTRLLDDSGGEPGALPLLQDTLDLLWRNRDGRQLTQQVYDAIGGLSGALRSQADALFDGLTAVEQHVVRQLLIRLVSRREDTAPDTRRRRLLGELRPIDGEAAERFDRVLALLVERRLVVRSEEGMQPAIEIAHEALIRRWDRLQRWIEEGRQRLLQVDQIEQWTKLWQAHGTLLDAKQLAIIEGLEKYSPEDLSPPSRQLLSHSRAWQLEKQRRLNEAIALADALLQSIDTQLGALAEAAALRRELLEKTSHLLDNLLFEAPTDPALMRTRMVAHHRRGDLALSHDRLNDAQSEYQAAMDLAAILAQSQPHGALAQNDFAASWNRLGKVWGKQGQLAEAAAAHQQAIAVIQKLMLQGPLDSQTQRHLAFSFDWAGKVALWQCQLLEAAAAHQQAKAALAQLVQNDPLNVQWQRDLAGCWNSLGDVERLQGHTAEALADYQQAFTIMETLVQQNPLNAQWQGDLAYCWNRLGKGFLRQGRAQESGDAHRRALSIMETLAERDHQNASWQQEVAFCWNSLGKVAARQGQAVEATAAYQRSLTILLTLAQRDPQNVGTQHDLAFCWSSLGDVARAQGQLNQAEAAYRQALAIHHEITQRVPLNSSWQRDLVTILLCLVDTLRPQPGKEGESSDLLAQAEQTFQRLRHHIREDNPDMVQLAEALTRLKAMS